MLGSLGCQQGNQDRLVLYSARSEAIADSLIEMYRTVSDRPIGVKYGTDAQLLALLKEEGEDSPADVFWANTSGALVNATNSDLFVELPDSIADRPARFVPGHRRWAPTTARFRVVAYNTNAIDSTDLPASVLDLPEMTSLEGRIGWTPAYSSFQDFVTALRVREGQAAARRWLEGMQALNPKSYTTNTPMIRALAAGEIDVALTNHYYVYQLKHGGAEGEYEPEEGEEHEEEEEEHAEGVDPSAPVKIAHFADGDLGNLALITGAGVLRTSDQSRQARDFLRFLLSEKAQSAAATVANEYPVVPSASVPEYMTPPETALRRSPQFDVDRLEDLDATLELLRSVGAL